MSPYWTNRQTDRQTGGRARRPHNKFIAIAIKLLSSVEVGAAISLLHKWHIVSAIVVVDTDVVDASMVMRRASIFPVGQPNDGVLWSFVTV